MGTENLKSVASIKENIKEAYARLGLIRKIIHEDRVVYVQRPRGGGRARVENDEVVLDWDKLRKIDELYNQIYTKLASVEALLRQIQ